MLRSQSAAESCSLPRNLCRPQPFILMEDGTRGTDLDAAPSGI
jgi:hypothetical protein